MKMLSSYFRPRCVVLRAALLCIGVLVVAPALLVSQSFDNPSEAERKTIEKNFDLLPLRFEPNQGQSSSNAKFLAQGRGFSAQFKENEADFLLASHSAMSSLLRVSLLNASRNAAVSGEMRLPGTVNYFIGNDREKWHSGLPTFERLRYASVYPGTDLIYYGNNGNMEFDYQLSPGATPSLIQMRFDGARSLKIDSKGDLIVTADGGQISFQKPVIYQPEDGGHKNFIAGKFRILQKNTVGFAVASYDHAKPLVIDPILNYSTYIGGYAQAAAIAVDKDGEAFVTGIATLDFPTTPGSVQPVGVPFSGAQLWPAVAKPFVAKFNRTGTALLYSTFLSGSGIDSAAGIALDANGDAFVVGGTSSTDFPITAGAFQTKIAIQTPNTTSQSNGFVTELNSTGSFLVYSTYLGGSSLSFVNHVAIDAAGNAYLTGNTFDTDFPTTQGAYRPTPVTKAIAPSSSAFIAKLNPAGSALVYSTYLAGSGNDGGYTIAVDSAGEAYVGGDTLSSDFPVTPGAFQTQIGASGVQTGFVTKLNASGSALLYSTYLGGNAGDTLTAIALDSNGNAYATGNTTSPDFPVTAGAFQSKIGIDYFDQTQDNAFVSKLNSTGTALDYSTFLGGGISLGPGAPMGDGANGIAVDGQGVAYVTGVACTGDFPTTSGAFEPQNLDGEIDGECTAFLTKMNPAPNTPLVYSTFLGGTGNGDAGDYGYGEVAYGIAIDSSGNVYLAGYTLSVDFPTTAGVVETAFADYSEKAFVTEFNGSEMKSLLIPTLTLTSNTSSVLFGQPVTFTATVQPASGNNTPTGYVGFNYYELEPSDDEGLGWGFGPWTTVAVNGSGEATFTISSLQEPTTQVNAFYLGDTNNAPATASMTQTVAYYPTTTTVTSNANDVPYGTPVVFTVTVLDSTGKPAAGFVAFLLGNIAYEETPLDIAGQATWTNGTGGSPLPLGTDTIEVEFYPNMGYLPSSGTLAETFTALGITPDPTFDPTAGTYTTGQYITLSDSNSAALIYYTIDGSTPVIGVSSPFVPGEIIEDDVSETIKAIAVAPGYSPSNVVSAVYTIPPGFTTGPGATTSMTVTQGSTYGNTGTVIVLGTNGFSGTVNLTCSVTTTMTDVNDMPTCSLNPVSVSFTGINGNNAQYSTLTVKTTGTSSAENRTKILLWVSPGGTALALALFFGGFRRSARWATLGLFALFICAGMTSCGGGSGNSGTTLGTYTITVTGISGGINATVGTVALAVQQ
jgi:hypothetical protein